jgi:outer membrane receptor protein involved in Fe transport
LLLLLALLVATSPALAQEENTGADAASEDREILIPVEAEDATPDPSGDMDEMVVLATGRDDFLKDLSVSSTSFGAAEIKSLRIQNIADLAEYTPNLEINTRSAASNPTLFIRGIGLKDYNANAAGAVAVYQDGININSPAIQLGQLFDTEEINVLRGPQGSLNGRNATAGAIMINSVLPDGEQDMWGSFSYGNYDNMQAEGGVSFPIVENLLSSRLAFTANFRDGTTDNNCADWDPESIGMPTLNEETIREAWAFNGNPDHSLRPDGRDIPSQGPHPRHPDYLHTEVVPADGWVGVVRQTSEPHAHLLAGDDRDRRPPFSPPAADGRDNPGKFPNQGVTAESDALGRPLVADNVCIWESPGFLEFDPLGNETWVPNEGAKTPADFQGLDHHVNNVENWASRGILRFQPDVGEGMDWILNFHGGQNLGDSRRLQSLATKMVLDEGDPFFVENVDDPSEALAALNSNLEFEGVRSVKGLYTPQSNSGNQTPGGRGGRDVDAGFYDLDGKEKLNTWGFSLHGLWNLGPVNLTSISGYEWYDRKINDEGDAVPVVAFPAIYEDDAWQVSQELRVAGEGERFRWFLGTFFLHDNLNSKNTFPGLRQRRIVQSFEQELTSGALYGNGRYWLLDEVYLDAGLRYNVEHKKFTLNSSILALEDSVVDCSNVGAGQPPKGCLIPEDTEKKTWTGVTGDATLAWEPGGDWMYDARLDQLNLYGKYGRGMKGGHFNAGLTIQGDPVNPQRIDPVKPEFLHAVEMGFKSRWFQDRLVVNFALFRYWYEDLQVFDFTNEFGELPIQQLLNSDAKVLGAEIEIQARPLPGLMVQFGAGWLDSEFEDFNVNKAVNAPRQDPNTPPVDFDYSGNPLISAPEWSLSGIVEYQIPLFSWGSIVPQYTFSYRTKVYQDPQKIDPISQDAYWVHGARLAYRTPDGRFEIAGWVENFLNERYKEDTFDLTLGDNAILEVWNDPRMYGVTFSAYF